MSQTRERREAVQGSSEAVRQAEELLSSPLPVEEPARSREVRRRAEEMAKLLSPAASAT
jgi:hypothetical protein